MTTVYGLHDKSCDCCNSEGVPLAFFKGWDAPYERPDQNLCVYCSTSEISRVVDSTKHSRNPQAHYHMEQLKLMAQCFNILEKRLKGGA